jgi:hypothetical protein
MLLAVGLVAAVLFFLATQFQSKPAKKTQAVEQKKQQDDNTASSQQQKSKTPIMEPVTPKEEQEGGQLSASDIAPTKKPGYASSQNEKPQRDNPSWPRATATSPNPLLVPRNHFRVARHSGVKATSYKPTCTRTFGIDNGLGNGWHVRASLSAGRR